MFVKNTVSVSGKRIRLTEERWLHISERHPEVASHLSEVLKTVSNPGVVTKGWEDEMVAIRRFGHWDLAVIYKENESGGFIITAFFTRSRKYFEQRGIIWSKES